MTKNKNNKEEVNSTVKPNDADETLNETVEQEGNGSEENESENREEEITNPMEELQNQLEEAKDKYIRLSAEFDNYRKRTQREKMDLIRFGSEDAMKAILPLVDDFERAVKHSETATDVEALKQGLVLIQVKFKEFLKANGVQEIEDIGNELDTDVHEAVSKTPAPKKELKGKIVDVVEKGYKLNDKVIRFSKVVIGE
ncbi:MAG TPA: nucleotide exchange factor GrpE [Bacteroidales bacterium]|jgi:molecular chaperone GrpE|nr:nucleotide exchange factor GrpE [Bacteroidales bacterium]